MPQGNDKTKTKSFIEKQLVIFTIGSEEFAVEINEVREIIKMEEITRIPDTEEYIEGIINLRGNIIVIIDLAKKLNLQTKKSTKDTRIIVIEVGNNTVGMIVDSCNEVIRLSQDKIEAAPDIIKKKITSDFLNGVGILGDRLIIMLNLAKVVGEDKINQIIAKQSNV